MATVVGGGAVGNGVGAGALVVLVGSGSIVLLPRSIVVFPWVSPVILPMFKGLPGLAVSVADGVMVGNGWTVSAPDVAPPKSKMPDRKPRPAIAQTPRTPVANTGTRIRKMSLFPHTQERPYVGRHEPSSLLNDERLRARHGQTS